MISLIPPAIKDAFEKKDLAFIVNKLNLNIDEITQLMDMKADECYNIISESIVVCIDKERLTQGLSRFKRYRLEDELITKLILADIPFSVLSQLFGMQYPDYQWSCAFLKHEPKKGRPKKIDDVQFKKLEPYLQNIPRNNIELAMRLLEASESCNLSIRQIYPLFMDE